MCIRDRVYGYVTCRLTVKKPGSAPFPVLVVEYGATLLLVFIGTLYNCTVNRQMRFGDFKCVTVLAPFTGRVTWHGLQLVQLWWSNQCHHNARYYNEMQMFSVCLTVAE